MKHESEAYAHAIKGLGNTRFMLEHALLTPTGRMVLEDIMESVLASCEKGGYHVEPMRQWYDAYRIKREYGLLERYPNGDVVCGDNS